MTEEKYDIALSFAGEDRAIVDKIAHLLKNNNIRVFYDNFEKANLWGENLYELLAKLYSEQAHFCLMFISKHYVKKMWTNHERQNAQERAFKEKGAYILPVRLDDTEIAGIKKTVGYIDLRQESIEQLVELVKEKLGKAKNTHSELTTIKENFYLKTLEPHLLAINLLNELSSAEFDTVIFRYNIPSYYLAGSAQAQKAIEVVKYACRKEGKEISQLFNAIYETAPYLKK